MRWRTEGGQSGIGEESTDEGWDSAGAYGGRETAEMGDVIGSTDAPVGDGVLAIRAPRPEEEAREKASVVDSTPGASGGIDDHPKSARLTCTGEAAPTGGGTEAVVDSTPGASGGIADPPKSATTGMFECEGGGAGTGGAGAAVSTGSAETGD